MWLFEGFITLNKNLTALKPMRTICLMRDLTLIDIGVIWLLSSVSQCLLMRIIISFQCNTRTLSFIKDHVIHVLLLIQDRAQLLNCLYF